MWIYAVTTFLSAFLLFMVQPMIAKRILPWFGGSPAVWTTCLLFFQTALLGGYAYAHWTSTRLRPRDQVVAHVVLMAIALCFLPVYPGDGFKPDDPSRPIWRILLLLGQTVLAPYFVLSATSPLLQRWFALRAPGRSPYALYALSNAGSLLALLAYPALFEPLTTLTAQAYLWAGGFGLFALACAGCAKGVWNRTEAGHECATPTPPPLLLTRALWLLLPCGGSVLLMAVTNQLCQDLVTMPFLWVLPLGVYLVTFILCFESDRWYRRVVFVPLAVLAVAAIMCMLFDKFQPGFAGQVGVYGGGLFVLCMVCHGELARLRPAPARLTEFYLMVSGGGALGGLFVAVIAPLVFRTYLELPLGLWACCALAAVAAWHGWSLREPDRARRPKWAYVVPVSAGLIALGAAVAVHAARSTAGTDAVVRDFYGVLRVKTHVLIDPVWRVREMSHGRTVHGCEVLWPDDRKRLPTAYYGPDSGIGLVFRYAPRPPGYTVGVVGLGIGTVALYGQTGERFRFYEINPSVADLARSEFSILASCPARCDVVLGDGRLSLEHEDGPAFDLLILDAFTGDAVPMHLLTREAFAVYARRLKPGGVIAVHISNTYMDFRPVVRGAAESAGLRWRTVLTPSDNATLAFPAAWMLLSADEDFLNQPAILRASRTARGPQRSILWTDESSNLLGVLR